MDSASTNLKETAPLRNVGTSDSSHNKLLKEPSPEASKSKSKASKKCDSVEAIYSKKIPMARPRYYVHHQRTKIL